MPASKSPGNTASLAASPVAAGVPDSTDDLVIAASEPQKPVEKDYVVLGAVQPCQPSE
jgi:hypothetical protein